MLKIENEFKLNFSDKYKSLKINTLSAFKNYEIDIFQKSDDNWSSDQKHLLNHNFIINDNEIVILHRYFKTAVVSIIEFLQKIASINNNGYFKLRELLSPFETLENEIDSYIAKEKQFSHLIKYLKDCEKFKERPKMRGFRSVQQLIKNLEVKHKKIILHTHQIQKLTNHFTLNYKTQNISLKSLFLEIHNLVTAFENWFLLESHIVFPQALALEYNLLNIY